ncbi:MAG: hypothetical protein ACKVP0_22180 [Pirellulaceae bacterium]
MQARFRIFKSGTSPWKTIFSAAASFATTLGPERLIGISHSHEQNLGLVTVWYWAIETEEWNVWEVNC